MVNSISGFFGSILKFFVLAILLGGLLGFVCSNGILTISINPENAGKAFKNTTANFIENGRVFINAFNESNRDPYMNDLNGSEVGSVNYQYRNRRYNNGERYKSYFLYHTNSGDTVYDLSRRYGISQHEIMSVNKISNPNEIYPGSLIIMPR